MAHALRFDDIPCIREKAFDYLARVATAIDPKKSRIIFVRWEDINSNNSRKFGEDLKATKISLQGISNASQRLSDLTYSHARMHDFNKEIELNDFHLKPYLEILDHLKTYHQRLQDFPPFNSKVVPNILYFTSEHVMRDLFLHHAFKKGEHISAKALKVDNCAMLVFEMTNAGITLIATDGISYSG